MASINLEDDELMEQDYYGDDDDDEVPEMPPMMAPLSPLAEYNENATNHTTTENSPLDGLLGEAGDDEGNGTKTRRIIKRKPQPKLDEARLTGPKGLPNLQKHFEKVKFKGKGHEVEDLNLLMTEMEHWMNRLYPRLTMKEMIMKLEKLGKKQKVKTCLAKIRMDMPILDEDFIGGEEELDEEEKIGEEEIEDEEDGVIRGEDEESRGNERLVSSQSESKPTLTEEQKKRIEEKKRLALERKAAKQAKEQEEQLGGLSQEELESIQSGEGSNISRIEAKMFKEIADTERELERIGGKDDKLMESKSKETNAVGNSLSQEEMDEIEKELMG